MKFVKITNRAQNGDVMILNSDDETLLFLCRWVEGCWHDVCTGETYRADRFTHYCKIPKLPE